MIGGSLHNNRASRGGGLSMEGMDALFLGIDITLNHASEYGGAAYVAGGVLRFESCTFDGNTAGIDAPVIAVYLGGVSTPFVSYDEWCVGITPFDIEEVP
jgi:hypothetical protein